MIDMATMNWKGWRTLGVAVAIGALGAVDSALKAGGVDLIPAPYVGPVLMGVGFIMAYLRSMSDTPMGKK